MNSITEFPEERLSDHITPSQEIFVSETSENLDRSYHPDFVRKQSVRVRVLLTNGKNCIGNCHVLWPDGRVSDVVNDERNFLIITDASVEGEAHSYSVLTLNKTQIAMLFEIHNAANIQEESA